MMVGEIENIKKLNIFLFSLFDNPKWISNVEWAEIEDGKRLKLSMNFRKGPFNEVPISFVYLSDYSRKIYKDNLFLAMCGALSQGAYSPYVQRGKIRITKGAEVTG